MMESFPLHTREIIEDEIERLIGILDAMEPDQDLEENGDLEPSLGWSSDRQSIVEESDDREGDWSDSEPSLGATNVQMPPPLYRLGGGHGHCLFPMHREQCELTYGAAGFSQVGWGAGPRNDFEDEHDGTEPCCEDEGAQCDDEGMMDNEDLSNCADDLGTLYNPDSAERNRVTDSIVAVNNELRAVMVRHGLPPVSPLSNMGGSIWGR